MRLGGAVQSRPPPAALLFQVGPVPCGTPSWTNDTPVSARSVFAFTITEKKPRPAILTFHVPGGRRFDGEETDCLKCVIVHLRGIDTKVAARRLNDCDELQALEGDEEVNTFDRRVEWNLEVVSTVVELAAGARHSFSRGPSRPTSRRRPLLVRSAVNSITLPPVASEDRMSEGLTFPEQGHPARSPGC